MLGEGTGGEGLSGSPMTSGKKPTPKRGEGGGDSEGSATSPNPLPLAPLRYAGRRFTDSVWRASPMAMRATHIISYGLLLAGARRLELAALALPVGFGLAALVAAARLVVALAALGAAALVATRFVAGLATVVLAGLVAAVFAVAARFVPPVVALARSPARPLARSPDGCPGTYWATSARSFTR